MLAKTTFLMPDYSIKIASLFSFLSLRLGTLAIEGWYQTCRNVEVADWEMQVCWSFQKRNFAYNYFSPEASYWVFILLLRHFWCARQNGFWISSRAGSFLVIEVALEIFEHPKHDSSARQNQSYRQIRFWHFFWNSRKGKRYILLCHRNFM